MNQPNRRNRSSAALRGSQGDPKEWVSPHLQQSPALVKASGHAVSPLVRRKTIQNAQLGRPRTDYDRRQIGANIGADLAPPQSMLGQGTDSYTRSSAFYTGTPPSGHVVTNAVTQLPVSPSPRLSRHTRDGSYTNHLVASPVSNITAISPPPSIRSPTAARARTRRATTTLTTTTDAPSLLFSTNQPSSHPTSTMDNYWPEPSVNGHSGYNNMHSLTSGTRLAHMPNLPNQYSHGAELYNYDGTCPPAVAGSERMPRGLPADSRPSGKIDASSVVFLPGSHSLPASNEDQRPVASLPEAPHTNSGLASYPDTSYPQLYIAPQTYSPNPAYYLDPISAYDSMSTPMPIHPRSAHVPPQYLQPNYDGNPHLVQSYYNQPPQSPSSLRSPSQHHRASLGGYAPYSLPGTNYVSGPAYHANELVQTSTLNALIEASQTQFIPIPSSTASGAMGSPLLHTSPSEPPSDLDRPHNSPALKNAARFPGQRLDVDQQLLNASFYGADEDSRNRRAVLDEIQTQGWYLYHEQEPRIESLSDPAARGLGMVGRSIYTVFLAQDESGSHWRCLFGGHGARCDRSSKQFERVERAIEHVRRHLGHRPYACDDVCQKSQTSGAPCGQRFFASQYLQDHKRRPQKRKSTAQS